MAMMFLSGCAGSGSTIRNATPISFEKAMTDLSAGISAIKAGSQRDKAAGSGAFGLLPTEITVRFNIAVRDSSGMNAGLTVLPASLVVAPQGGIGNKSTDSAKNDVVIIFKNIYFDKDGLFDITNAKAKKEFFKDSLSTPMPMRMQRR